MKQKQLKLFDVVELKDNSKAIVKDINNENIKVEIITKNGKKSKIQKIYMNDIKDIIYKH